MLFSERTQKLLRFQGTVPAGETVEIAITRQRVWWQGQQLLSWNDEQLLSYAGNQALPDELREALRKAAALRGAISEVEAKIQERQRELNEIAQEQKRIRANMNSVQRDSAYYNRLLEKLDQQETRIEELRKQLDKLQQQRSERQQALRAYLEGLQID